MNKTNKKDLNEMPYERFIRFGPESLTDAELLAIIIRTGTKEKNALELAKEVLQLAHYPEKGIRGLHQVSLKDLQEINGIGEVKAVKIKCIAELSVRMRSSNLKKGIYLNSSGKVAEYFMERLRNRETECVYLLSLDNKGKLLQEKKLSEGSVRMSLISAREIFLEALHARAVNILLVHNHPSGDPKPSKADITLTNQVREMSEKMDIPLLDHIIIGDNCFISFKEAGWFQG